MHFTRSWRFLSFLVLLLYALLVVAFVLLLAKNIIMALILGVTSLLLIYSVWLIFAGPKRDAKIGQGLAVLASGALVIELIYFLSDQKNRRALYIIIGLTALYLILFGILRKKYWSLMREKGILGGKTAHFKNPYLIINPVAGNGRATKAHIKELAEKQGITVIVTKKGGEISDYALQAVKAGADVLGISGGDGSIGAVAKVALKYKLPMVVLPGGTRCHFARDLGLDPKEIRDSLAGFTGVERQIDAGEINGRIFLNNASFGLYADIVDHPEYRDNKMKVSRKVLQQIVSGKKELYDLRFKHGDTSIKKAVQVLVGVNQYDTVNLLDLGHRQRLDQGVLQVNAITELNNQLVKELLTAMSIKQLSKNKQMPGLYQWVDKTFAVRSSKKEIVVGVDGEREVYKTPVTVKIMPGALRIYLPAEGERARRKNPLSISVVQKVWKTARQ